LSQLREVIIAIVVHSGILPVVNPQTRRIPDYTRDLSFACKKLPFAPSIDRQVVFATDIRAGSYDRCFRVNESCDSASAITGIRAGSV